MLVRSSIIGVGITIAIVAILASSRLLDTAVEDKGVALHELSRFELAAPPPPPSFVELEPELALETEVEPLPPSPTLEWSPEVKAVEQLTISQGLDNVSMDFSVNAFHTSMAPAAVPTPTKPVTVAKQSRRSTGGGLKPSRRAIVSKPKTKAFYSPSELDRTPVERARGSYTWPGHARGRIATVKLHIEIDTAGGVRVIKVVSSSNTALNAAAKKVARGSRYSVPTVEGRAVKAQFFKTYKLQKPR